MTRGRVPFRFLLISGSTRRRSTNTALLRTALTVAPAEVAPTLFEGMTALPHFNPDEDADGAALADGRPLDAAVRALRAAVADAHAVLLSTPEYAGALPGSFKNLLDWCVGDAGMYDKPVVWINVSSSPTGAKDAHASLATVLRYLHADVVTPACAHIPVARHLVGADGLIADADVRARIVQVLLALAAHIDELRNPNEISPPFTEGSA